MTELYAQGDVLIEKVDKELPRAGTIIDALNGVHVIAEGEKTGHCHAVTGDVIHFRDYLLAKDLPSGLYVCHVTVAETNATLKHDEHDPITLKRGTYRIRRQREYDGLRDQFVAD